MEELNKNKIDEEREFWELLIGGQIWGITNKIAKNNITWDKNKSKKVLR